MDNGGESPDGRTTTFRIDPKAVWSDGVPIVADDFLFAHHLFADPNVDTSGPSPFDQMRLTALDPRTVQIQWSVPYGDYLTALAEMPPLPLHVFATGPFAGVYDPRTDTYNSALAQRLVQTASFNTTIPVDNGPFTVQSFPPRSKDPWLAGPAVLVRNPRFFSNFFHHPAALDQVTIVSAWPQTPKDTSGYASRAQLEDTMITQYRQGHLTLAEGFEPLNLPELGGIPTGEVITSPADALIEYGFNLRGVASNAQANGGASIFKDPAVRKAFVEAFNRCAAIRALLGINTCNDPNLHSDENTAPPAQDYDPTFKLPAYNPTDAAALLDHAGYRVVDGVRRAKDGTTPLQLRLALSYSGTPSAGFARSMQQDYARNLHISVTIVPYQEFDTVAGTYDLVLWANSGFPDPVGAWAGSDAASIPSAQNPSGQNFTGILDPYLEQRDQFGAQVVDPDQRAVVYQALQRYYTQQFYVVPVYIQADIALVQPRLCNFKKWPLQFGAMWNMADWYVAASCPEITS